MSQILVISAHQDLNQSTSNSLILSELENQLGEQVTIVSGHFILHRLTNYFA